MRTLMFGLLISSSTWTTSACQDDSNARDEEQPTTASPASRLIPQVLPPLDIKTPPDDAAKTSSGLAYKKLTARSTGTLPQRSDTVLVHYTGWRQRTGDTFFTTKGNSQPMSLDIAHTQLGFSEALQLLRKGEKAILWIPPNQTTPETLVYEIELVDVISPTPVDNPPAPVDNPPSTADKLAPKSLPLTPTNASPANATSAGHSAPTSAPRPRAPS